MDKVNDLVKQRAVAFDAFEVLANKDKLTSDEQKDYESKKRAVTDLDDQIKRARDAQALAAASARPIGGQERVTLPAEVTTDCYTSKDAAEARGLVTNKGLAVGGMMRMLGQAAKNNADPVKTSAELYGERHPVTRALITSVGASGGFIIPPDYMNEIIELLRPKAVVRAAGPRTIPMPRGTMTLPGQQTPATATYQGEVTPITQSQQTLNQIVATFKKLTALVPVSNDMMRYADPAVDAFVRDDLVKVVRLREDLAFLTGDGTSNTPRGMLSFANEWVVQQGGTAGYWSSSGNSTAAVDGSAGSALTGQNGGNFITSNESYTLATAASELGGLVNKLDTANVEEEKRVWFFNPRTYNYLFNVQNSLGVYVYRDELRQGTLLGYPYKKSTQIPINIWDANGSNKDCSFIFLTEMDEAIILDSMQMELAVSREGTYVDSSGVTQSAFQNDQTLIRAVEEHDFQMRHAASVAVAQFVRWAPAIS